LANFVGGYEPVTKGDVYQTLKHVMTNMQWGEYSFDYSLPWQYSETLWGCVANEIGMNTKDIEFLRQITSPLDFARMEWGNELNESDFLQCADNPSQCGNYKSAWNDYKVCGEGTHQRLIVTDGNGKWVITKTK
jgi:hypothetical protein